MSQAQGSSVSLRVGVEPAFGTDATATKEVPFIPTLTLSQTQNQNESGAMNGTRDASPPFLGYKSAQSTFSVPLDSKLAGYWMKAFLGTASAPVDNGNGTYTHTFTRNDTTLPSFTIEKAHTDIGSYQKGNGFRGNTFTVNFGGEDEVKLDLEFLGQKVTLGAAELAVPATGQEGVRFEPFQCSLTGATNVKTASLTFANNLDGNQYVIGDGGERGDIPLGMIGVSGSITALYENDTLLTTALNSTEISLTFTFTNGTNTIDFVIDELKLEPTGVDVSSPLGIEQTFNFKAYWKDGASNSSLKVVLTNDVSTQY